MDTEMTRGELRWLIDPERISEISVRPIKPATFEGVLFGREYMWKSLILLTVRPLYLRQIRKLKEYRHLLTEDEKRIADDYEEAISKYDNEWLFHKYLFPPQPKAFQNILK